MTDWKAIAGARGIGIAAKDLDRTVAPLNELEQIFRSLVPDLPFDLVPAFDVRIEEDE